MKSRKPIVLFASVLVLALATVGSAASAPRPPLTLGVVLATSGPFAGGETPLLNGIRMAVQDVNAKGGINGRRLRISVADTGSSQTGAVNAYNLAVSQKPVAIIDTTVSNLVLAQVPAIKDGGVPTIGGGGAVAIGRQNTGLTNFFRIRTSDALVPRAATRFALDNLKMRRVGLLTQNSVTGRGWHDAIVDVLAARKLEPVAEATFAGTDLDFTPQLLRMKNAGADVVIAYGDPANHAIIWRQRKQLGLQFELIASNGGVLPTTLSIIPHDVSEGVYGTLDSVPAAAEKTKAWAARYTNTYGIDSDSLAAEYYDGVMMLANAISKGGTKPAAIIDGLNRIRIYRGVGNTYAYAGKGDGGSRVAIVKVHDGKVSPVRTFGG